MSARRRRRGPPGTYPWTPGPSGGALATLGLTLSLPSGETLLASTVEWRPARRVIASEYASENLFDRLALDVPSDALREIADLTNPAALHARQALSLVAPEDRIAGEGSALIMSAFVFPAMPSRFGDGTQGTFYAARDDATAVAETRHHRERVLRECGAGPLELDLVMLHVDVAGELVDVRRGRPSPDGIYDPADYSAGQRFGAGVRSLGGDGIVFDSVRRRGGECVAVFRPPALSRCRPVRTLVYRWDGGRIADVRSA